MKTFYSAEDIETLAGQGVHELIVDDDTVLTSVAREAAAQLGVRLVALGQGRAAGAAPAAPAATPQKPRGCQHGPLSGGKSSSGSEERGAGAGGGPVVDELIGAVKQLARRG